MLAQGAFGNVLKVQREDDKKFYAMKVRFPLVSCYFFAITMHAFVFIWHMHALNGVS